MARQASTAPIIDGAPGNAPEYSVSELSGAVKKTLESGFEHVRVRGELGRISRPSSGHVYLDLKDDRAVLAGVIWKGVAGRLRFQPEQGMEVVATGRITTFPGQSKYQLVIEQLAPAGLGALMALLEERKKKLAAEGLFDEARKKPLPFLPRVIGIVTSPSGAVIRDMLHGFDERFPSHVLLWPVRVQGETCAAEVAAAIRGFNAFADDGPIPRPDVLIVARGGGSLEDLWGFNEEAAVRAAAESALPVISAVGHETDWTLIDLVADARAPTPTKAAEWAVPKHSELLDRLREIETRQRIALHRRLESSAERLRSAARGLPRRDVLFAAPRQLLDRTEHRLVSALVSFTNRSSLRLAKVSSRFSHGLLASQTSTCRERLRIAEDRGRAALMRSTGHRRVRLETALAQLRPSIISGRVGQSRERLSSSTERMQHGHVASLRERRQHLEALGKLLQSLSHKGVLSRGFALVRDSRKRMVRTSDALVAGQAIEVEFSDGRRHAVAGEAAETKSEPPDGAGTNEMTTPRLQSTDSEARRPSRKGREPDQGTLL